MKTLIDFFFFFQKTIISSNGIKNQEDDFSTGVSFAFLSAN